MMDDSNHGQALYGTRIPRLEVDGKNTLRVFCNVAVAIPRSVHIHILEAYCSALPLKPLGSKELLLLLVRQSFHTLTLPGQYCRGLYPLSGYLISQV